MLERSRLFVVGLVACCAAPATSRLEACSGTPCSATGPIAIAVDSVCAPMSPSSVATISVPLRILNTSYRCNLLTLDVSLSVTVVGGVAPLSVTLPTGPGGDSTIPSNPFRLVAHAAETGSIVVEYPAGATGSTTFHVHAAAPGLADVERPFSISLFSSFYAVADSGNATAAPGEERQLSWTIVNPGARTRTIQYAIRVLQTSSSANPLLDRFPEADCAAALPPGDASDTNPTSPDFLAIGQLTIPGHASAPVCVRTASYPACVEGSNCLYRMTLSESLSGDSGDANQNLTVIEPRFVLDGGAAIDPVPAPAIGLGGLAFLVLLVAGGGVLLVRRSA
jgi:hypothetical protein